MTPDLVSKIQAWHSESEGWTTVPQLVELAELIQSERPRIATELGSFGGRNAVVMAMAMKEMNYGKIYTIDPMRLEHALEGENEANQDWWKNNVGQERLNSIHQYCLNAIWKYNLEQWCVVIRAASQFCCELFNQIDFLLIDGDHAEVPSCRDVANYLPRVVSGGLIYFDDSDWPSTHKALWELDLACTLLKDGGDYRIYRKK